MNWEFWVRWEIATVVGWVGGMVAAIALSYLVVNIFYPKETNLIVGLCIGATMATLQSRAVRRWVQLGARWIWGGTLVMAPYFVARVVFEELALSTEDAGVRAALLLITAVGGVAGALIQSQSLRSYTARYRWWVPASAAAWGLAFASSYLLGFLGSGVVLGAVGGLLLLWLIRPAANQGTQENCGGRKQARLR